MLCVLAHGPAGENKHKRRDVVTFGLARGPVFGKKNANHAGTPPDNTHTGMLVIAMAATLAPSVLSESVHNTPGGNDATVIKLLALVAAGQGLLAEIKHNGKNKAVGNERRAHDSVG